MIDMDRELDIIKTEIYLKVAIKMISEKDMVKWFIPTVIFMKENGIIQIDMEQEFSYFKMEVELKANGLMTFFRNCQAIILKIEFQFLI